MNAIWRVFWGVVFTGHLVAAAAWWWLMPGGFPAGSAKFVANRIFPAVIIVVSFACLVEGMRGRTDRMRAMVTIFPALWLAAAITSRICFPITMQRLWLAPLGVGVVMLAGLRCFGAARAWAAAVCATFGAILGIAVTAAQRAPAADTRPRGGDLALSLAADSPAAARVIRLSPVIRVQPNGGIVYIDAGTLHLDIEPLLTFITRSPDRCWDSIMGPSLISGSKGSFDYDAAGWVDSARYWATGVVTFTLRGHGGHRPTRRGSRHEGDADVFSRPACWACPMGNLHLAAPRTRGR